jgi:hypothetical protein
MSFHSLSPLKGRANKIRVSKSILTFPRFNIVTKNLKTPFNANPSTWWSPPLNTVPRLLLSPITQPHSQLHYIALNLN